MKSAALLGGVFLLGAGVIAGTALADGLPVPLPTISVPSLPLPTTTTVASLPSTPAITTPPIGSTPVPSLPAPSVGTATSPPLTAAGGTSGSRGSSSSASSSSSSSSSASASPSSSSPSASSPSSSSSSAGGQASRSPSIHGLRSSRTWLATRGARNHRATVLRFRLAQAGRIVFTVVQVSPVCRIAGSFSIHGHAGLNRVRFRGRVGGRLLLPGTYRLNAHTPRGGTVVHVVLAVFGAAPSPNQLAIARRSSVCSAADLGRLTSNTTGALTAAPPAGAGDPGGLVGGQNPSDSGVAGASVEIKAPDASAFSPTAISRKVSNPLVIAALALAIVLLGLAAIPPAAIRDPGLTEVLSRHRLEAALAGAAAFIAALVALAL
jgi:hypothetical protein